MIINDHWLSIIHIIIMVSPITNMTGGEMPTSSKSVAWPRLGSIPLPGWTRPSVCQHLYLFRIPKRICLKFKNVVVIPNLKFQNIFVSNWFKFLCQASITQHFAVESHLCCVLMIYIRTMSPEAIAEAKEFAEKENLHGVVRLLFFCQVIRDFFLNLFDTFSYREAEKRTQRKKKMATRSFYKFSFRIPFLIFWYFFQRAPRLLVPLIFFLISNSLTEFWTIIALE